MTSWEWMEIGGTSPRAQSFSTKEKEPATLDMELDCHMQAWKAGVVGYSTQHRSIIAGAPTGQFHGCVKATLMLVVAASFSGFQELERQH